MRGLARWCIAHRRRVVLAWVAGAVLITVVAHTVGAVLITVVAHTVGPNYLTSFGLPGTQRPAARGGGCQPYGPGGEARVSANRMTAFATVNYDQPANVLANSTGKPLLAVVNHPRDVVLPALKRRTGVTVLVGGFTAGSIDFSHVLGGKLPLFFGLVILLSALLLFVMFHSLVIPVQAAVMHLLTIGAALGVTVLVFQHGWLAGVPGVQKGPIEAWVP